MLVELAYHFVSLIDSRIEPVPFRPEDFVDEDPLVWEVKKEGIAIMPEIVSLTEK